MSDDRLFGRDFKVLVADDSATTRLTIAREFIGPGVEIIQARDGLEALEKAKSQAPNIITLDIMMPGLDGYEVCEELMMYDSTMDIPIVMISSRSNEDERYRSLEAGALEYYIKPFEVGALRKFVFKLLKQVGINQNKVIFCLDRRRAIRAMVQGFLQDAGYQVRLFRSAQEVQSALAAEEECDLLLLDFELPNAGGLKLLDWVRSQRIHDFLPVIAMTASGERKDLAIAFRRGGNDYLRKPFFPEELLARIENQLQLGRVKEQLQRGAIFDPLTGLPNRSGLKRALAIELARALRDGHGLGIIVFDIDHFKRVNDSYGHLIGDDVLRVVGERMTESLRLTDIVARYGGGRICGRRPLHIE